MCYAFEVDALIKYLQFVSIVTCCDTLTQNDINPIFITAISFYRVSLYDFLLVLMCLFIKSLKYKTPN